MNNYSKGALLKIISVCALLLLTACAGLNYSSDDEPTLKRFEISLPNIEKKNPNPQGPSLAVYEMRSNNLYNSIRMTYSLRPHEISYYSKNEWVDTPTRLLTSLIISTIENSGLVAVVVRSGSSAIADMALDTELLTLLHKYEENSSKVILSVRVQLVDLRKRSILGSDTLTIEEATPSNDPYGAVLATNAAVEHLTQSIQQFIQQHIQ